MDMAPASDASATRLAYRRPFRAMHPAPRPVRAVGPRPPPRFFVSRLSAPWQREYSSLRPASSRTHAARAAAAALLTQNLFDRSVATRSGSPPAPRASLSASQNLSLGMSAAPANLSHHRSMSGAPPPPPAWAPPAGHTPPSFKSTWAYSWKIVKILRLAGSLRSTSMTAGLASTSASPATPSSGIFSCMANTFCDSIFSLIAPYLLLSLSAPCPASRGGSIPRAARFWPLRSRGSR